MDGPGGAGKGTVAKAIARILGYHYLDSGALYRTVACSFLRSIRRDSSDGYLALLALDSIQKMSINSDCQICYKGVPVGNEIRTPEVERLTPRIAHILDVRLAIRSLQFQMRMNPGTVAEGRDMCYLFEDPNLFRVYLDASPEARANRRLNDPRFNKDGSLDPAKVIFDINERDRKDRESEFGKLRIHPEALYVDSSDINADQVVERIMSNFRAWEKSLEQVAK